MLATAALLPRDDQHVTDAVERAPRCGGVQHPKPRRCATMSNVHTPSSPFVPFSPNPALQSGMPVSTPPLSAQKTPQLASSSLRYASSRKSIYERQLNRTQRSELSKASFSFLFGEMVQYAQKQVSGIQDLEKKWPSLAAPPLRRFPFSLARTRICLPMGRREQTEPAGLLDRPAPAGAAAAPRGQVGKA